MKPGQIAQLQELSKCYFHPRHNYRDKWISMGIALNEKSEKLNKWEKEQLLRLSHQYRDQIAAMRKNRAKQ
jgi:hypothetical protein